LCLDFFSGDDDDNDDEDNLDDDDDDDDADDADKEDSEVAIRCDEGGGGMDSIAGVGEVLPVALSAAEGVPSAGAMLMTQLWCRWEQSGGGGGGRVSPATCALNLLMLPPGRAR
jgi:hypothetical protein